MFRRLGAFPDSFDLEAAEAVAVGRGLEAHHVVDQLALLVDKSLVQADGGDSDTRYRLLETVRQYAVERLQGAEDADARRRHRDHYLAVAEAASARVFTDEQNSALDRLEVEFDNLRSALAWSQDRGDNTEVARFAAAVGPMWRVRGRWTEAASWMRAWLRAVKDQRVEPALRVAALTAAAEGSAAAFHPRALTQAEEAVALARELDDKRLYGRALGILGDVLQRTRGDYRPHLDAAIAIARELGDTWALARHLATLCEAVILDDPAIACGFAEEASALARRNGDHATARTTSWQGGEAMIHLGELARARTVLHEVAVDADAARDRVAQVFALSDESWACCLLGEVAEARRAGNESTAVARKMGAPVFAAAGQAMVGLAGLASGTLDGVTDVLREGWAFAGLRPGFAEGYLAGWALVELYAGDTDAARQLCDGGLDRAAVSKARVPLGFVLYARARVAAADGELERAEDLAHQTLAIWRETNARTHAPDALELLASVAANQESHQEAARLYGAAESLRRVTGYIRFAVARDSYASSVAHLREAMGDDAFDGAWSEGEALSFEEAIAYANRGRGERRRPSIGWASLTPAETDIVRLVAEGLANKEIAARLFISPRTVQTHLTHIYTKLNLSSRVQLAKEADRRH